MVHETLSLGLLEQDIGALAVVQLAGVVAEIELREVAVQVRFRQVVEGAVHAALEDREVAFDGVCVPEAAPDIFVGGVIHGTVAFELFADGRIDNTIVRHEVGLAVGVLDEDRAQRLGVDIGDTEGPDFAVTFDEGEDGDLLGRRLGLVGVAGFAAD